MKHIAVLGAALTLFAASSLVQALPTIGAINETTVLNAVAGEGLGPGAAATFTGGATGGLQVPTADIQVGNAISIDRGELEVARIPSIRFLAGVKPNLELGAGYEDVKVDAGLLGAGDITARTWNINAKYALPVKLGPAAVAIGANYNKFEVSDDALDASATNIYLAGTMPYKGGKFSANMTFTMLDVDDVDLEQDNDIAFGLGYEKAFENGTIAGAELVLSAGDLLTDDVDGINYANIYLNVPINEKMTGRVALSGIGKFTTTNIGVTLAL